MFSPSEEERYKRHFTLESFGRKGQEKLKNARVLVVGAGALGCPVLTYLAAAGVGKLGIVDNDTVELSNLHRQPLYTVLELGLPKAIAAEQRLRAINPEIEVKAFQTQFVPENAMELVRDYDLVVDATDNFPTRYLINDVCVLTGKPNVHGSVVGFTGTVSVFNYKNGPDYRDLFPVPPTPEEAPSCAVAGVIGVIPSVIGSLQAAEVIKILSETGDVASGRFIRYDVLTGTQHVLRFGKDPGNPLNSATEKFIFETDYPAFCHQFTTINMKSITVSELKALKDQGADFQLIDVRETYEHDICSLGGLLIPMGEIPANVDQIAKDKQVVVHCKSGRRSENVIGFLEANFGFTNLYNLEGGILAWANEIDPEMEQY